MAATGFWVFRGGRRIAFALTLTAAAFVPWFSAYCLLSFTGDFLLVVYLLAFSRFVLMLGALDTGSSFAGMGASREAMVSALAEAPLLLSLIAVAILAQSSTLGSIVGWTATQNFFDFSAFPVLPFSPFSFILVANTAR